MWTRTWPDPACTPPAQPLLLPPRPGLANRQPRACPLLGGRPSGKWLHTALHPPTSRHATPSNLAPCCYLGRCSMRPSNPVPMPLLRVGVARLPTPLPLPLPDGAATCPYQTMLTEASPHTLP